MKRSYETAFSRQLRIWMAQADVSAEDLARAVGVERQSVYRWRSGLSDPSDEWWAAIAQALGIERRAIAELLYGLPEAEWPADVRAFAEWLSTQPLARRRELLATIENRLELDSSTPEGEPTRA